MLPSLMLQEKALPLTFAIENYFYDYEIISITMRDAYLGGFKFIFFFFVPNCAWLTGYSVQAILYQHTFAITGLLLSIWLLMKHLHKFLNVDHVPHCTSLYQTVSFYF